MNNLTARETATLKALLAKIDAAAPAKSQPESLVAAKVHCHDARIARRTDAARKGGAGMTKAEKSELYAALTAKYGKRPSTAQWNAACKKVRGI